jgi:hypothetical protein
VPAAPAGVVDGRFAAMRRDGFRARRNPVRALRPFHEG